MKPLSIKTKLMIGGITLVFLPLLLVGLIAMNRSTDALLTLGKDNARANAVENARLDSAAGMISESSGPMRSRSENLQKMAAELNAIVGSFKV